MDKEQIKKSLEYRINSFEGVALRTDFENHKTFIKRKGEKEQEAKGPIVANVLEWSKPATKEEYENFQ